MTPSATIIQNRHILAQLSVQLWAQRQASTAMIDATNQALPPPISSNQAIGQAAADVILQNILGRHSPTMPNSSKDEQKSEQMASVPKTPTDSQADDLQEESLDTKDSVAVDYQMQAIRYQNWILLVDVAYLTSATQAVWHSLQQSLAAKAQSNSAKYTYHQWHFPLCEPIASQHIMNDAALAQMTFLGALYNLSQADAVDYAILTDIHPALSLPSSAQDVPSLSQMAEKGEFKKQLWQLLHSSADE